jgi:hypothetical protein
MFTLQNIFSMCYKHGRSSKRVALSSFIHAYVYRLYKSNSSLRQVTAAPVTFAEVSKRLDYNQHIYIC